MNWKNISNFIISFEPHFKGSTRASGTQWWKCSDRFLFPVSVDERFENSLLKGIGAETPSREAGFCVLASSSGSKHKDVWMRGLVAVPCQCPKWLSAPSASVLGTRTAGTAWQSLNCITVRQEKYRRPTQRPFPFKWMFSFLQYGQGSLCVNGHDKSGHCPRCAKLGPVIMQTKGRKKTPKKVQTLLLPWIFQHILLQEFCWIFTGYWK